MAGKVTRRCDTCNVGGERGLAAIHQDTHAASRASQAAHLFQALAMLPARSWCVTRAPVSTIHTPTCSSQPPNKSEVGRSGSRECMQKHLPAAWQVPADQPWQRQQCGTAGIVCTCFEPVVVSQATGAEIWLRCQCDE